MFEVKNFGFRILDFGFWISDFGSDFGLRLRLRLSLPGWQNKLNGYINLASQTGLRLGENLNQVLPCDSHSNRLLW